MSYNTRRTGGAGRGVPTTQVNYHQQQARPGSNSQQTRNPGYSTTQQTNYNSSAQPAFSTQPGYTSAPPAPAQPKVVQQQPQVAAQPPLPPQVKTPSTPTPVLKPEPLTPADTPKMETSENGDSQSKQPFWKKKPFVKVSNKVRRQRLNAKLRRILNPKNALTFLNEFRPGEVKFNVREEGGWGGFVATVDIDGQTFTGHGMTVSKAKVQASEQALKTLLLEQLSKAQTTTPTSTTETKEDKEAGEEDVSMETESESGEPKAKKVKVELPEDEVPWGSLAAFALHKLFAEWQKEGLESSRALPQDKYEDDIAEETYFARRPVPPEFGFPRRFPPGPYGRGRGFGPYPPRGPPPSGFGMPARPMRPPPAATFLAGNRSNLGGPATSLTPTMLPMKKIPEDANKRHPVMMLNQLKPNVIYNESREGEPPRVMFNISVEIDGKEYVGRGKSKKDAKKNAAKAALAPLGIVYTDDE